MILTATEQGRLMMVRADVVARVIRTMDRFEKETGEKSYIIRGWVSYSSQAKTYADSVKQGFQAVPANVSRHPLGAAVDIGIVGHVHDDAAVDQRDPLYGVLARIAAEEGLDAGYYWTGTKPDPYHVQARETLAQSRAAFTSLTRGRLWRAAAAVASIGVIFTIGMGRRRLSRGR